MYPAMPPARKCQPPIPAILGSDRDRTSTGSNAEMAQREPPGPETLMTLGTATPGGGFPLYGAAAPRIELVHPGVLRYLREIGLLS